MLFDNRELEGIATGRITLVFRSWTGQRVNIGTKLRSRIGLVEVVDVTVVAPAAISDTDLTAAGFAGRDEFAAWRDDRPGELFRIAVRPAGPDPRIALRHDDQLDEHDLEALAGRLSRMDRAASEPWTRETLELIAANPARVSTELAAEMGLERGYFKRRVRRLKELGLTESLEVGYRISPRGKAFLDATGSSAEGE